MHRRIVFIVATLVSLSVVSTMTFMSISDEDLSVALTAFRNSTQDVGPMRTEKVIREIEKEKKSDLNLGSVETESSSDPAIVNPTQPSNPYVPGAPQVNQDWMSIVADTKQLLATQIGHYSQQELLPLTMADGTVGQIRPDCSGYVKFCLWRKGILDASTNIWSGSGSDGGTIPGVECHAMSELSDYSQLLPGDIVFMNGHVEIIAQSPPPGQGPSFHPTVYTCGSNTSAAIPGPSGGMQVGIYTYFWRVP